MSVEDELLALERRQLTAFSAWDHVRQLSASVPLGHRPGIGGVARLPVLRQMLLGIQRLRYAAVLAERQRDLNLIGLERASRLTQLIDQRFLEAQQGTTALDRDIIELDQRVSAARDLAALVHRDVGQAMIEVNDRIDTTTSYVTYMAAELHSDYFTLEEATCRRLTSAEAQLDEQVKRWSVLDEESRLHGSHIRRLEQSGRVQAERATPSNYDHPLAGDRLPRLIALLEGQFPKLDRALHVGMSIQDGAADEMIALQAEHFGDRLGLYGTRDDAWYHVDFTPDWNRDILFENALSKLKPGGYLVLISDPDMVDTVKERPLTKVLSHVFALSPTVQASVHVWERP